MCKGEQYANHVAPDDDSRISHVGLWLRRWRLDELPQLFNILRGDMSLVGPRPMPAEHANAIPPALRERILSVRPGLTGRAALDFLAEDHCLAGEPDPGKVYIEKLLPAKVDHDLKYLDDSDPLKDWRILGETLFCIWSPKARHKSQMLVNEILQNRQD